LYAWDVPSGNLKRLTDQPTGVNIGWLSPDGKYIFYLHDEKGNEIGHYVRVPFDGGESEDITPDMPPYASSSFGQSKNGLFRGFTVAGHDGFQIYIQSGDDNRSMVYHHANLCFGPTFSADGSLAVVTSTERSGTLDTNLLVFESGTGDQIAELWDGKDSSISIGRFSPIEGDDRLLATTSVSGFNRPLVWNPRTGERKDLMVDKIPGDIDAWDWSPDAAHVLLRQLYQAEYRLCVYHLQSDTFTKLNHPEGVLDAFFGTGFYAGNEEIYVNWEDTVHPPRLIALDANTGEQTRIVLKAGDSPAGPNMRSVTFESENGAMIQAWVATPDDGEGPYPTILHTHGGPTSVQKTTFAPRLLAWLDHGFAVMSVNYHGSTTFGKSFEKSIWGNLGDLEIGDMAAAYQWLVDNKIARPDEVLLTGGSYGGYLTLQAIGKRPELWAGGMASIAIADWKLMYEDQAETLRAYQHALFGGSPDETPQATKKSSPITYAENIRAPLLVIQGKNDTRCPSRQMEAYEAKLKQHGKPISIHWFEAGHGSLDQEQQIEHQELMLRFAYQILG
jgi:dipeptidyl aminopeptidase/acylaminoacyl peptidase